MNEADADRAAWTAWTRTVDGAVEAPDTTSAQVSAAVATPPVDKVGGARSIALGLAVGRDAGWPLLAWKLPLLPWVLDRVYGVVAANRRRLPGETPWCEVHADQCAEFAP